MDLLLFILGILGMVVCLILLLVSIVRKKPKKKLLIGLCACFIIFVIGVSMPESNFADLDSKKEIETANEENLNEEELEILNKSYNDLTDMEKNQLIVIKSKMDNGATLNKEQRENLNKLLKEKEEYLANLPSDKKTNDKKEENKKIELQPIEEDRKSEIENAIKSRIDDGKYRTANLDKIIINENLGQGVEGTYIALVYFKFDIMNTRETGNKVMRMYSDDLAATLANKGIKDVAEIAIFWEDDYNKRNVKYAYEYKNGNFYVMDIAGE